MTIEDMIPSGRHSEEPPACDLDEEDTRWVQQRLFPPFVVESVIRLRYAAESSHVAWQIEVYDPATRELHAMMSVPHRFARSPQDAAQQALTGLLALFLEVVDPDPF